jgi:hypothetical protein
MNRRRLQLVLALGVVSLLGAVGVAVATGGGGVRERLTGYEEVPAISSPASGEFAARFRGPNAVEFRLSYRGFTSNVTQAHIHFAQEAVNGGVSVWLCGNPSPTVTPPPGTAMCPLTAGTVRGVIEPDDVVGPAGQGIAPGEFGEFLAAVRAGRTYANVHTATFPGGEIRAQLLDGGDDDDDD